MGRATRWLKGLFGVSKNRDQTDPSNSGGGDRNKKGTFGHSGRGSTGLCHNPATIPPNITPAEASWLRSFYNSDQPDNEQSKHAIAVAAATAAAADAAVAAAQAAVAVVRLTSQGRDTVFGLGLGRGRDRWAAVRIQTIFRGYLSRKALRALKGLVKLQALVRGYLVRKQATATLHGIQALIRAQATVRTQKARPFNKYGYGGGGGGGDGGGDCFHSQCRSRKSMERFDDTRSEQQTTPIHSRRLSSSSSFETPIKNPFDEETPKIVEIDTGTSGRPKSRSRRTNTWVSDSGAGHSLSYQTLATRLSIPTRQNSQDSNWDECRCCTAQSTPRIGNSCGSDAPVTPATARSVCVDNFFRQYTNFPNYMASTQSFKAKLRSQSAPKQRPETGHKKKLSLNEMVESRSSVSGVKMQSSCSQVEEVVNFKNAVMGKFDRSSYFY